jgi:hypothetical protein
MESVALPSGAAGVEIALDVLAPGFAAEAVAVAAVPPLPGIVWLGARTARLQVCSNGPNVNADIL